SIQFTRASVNLVSEGKGLAVTSTNSNLQRGLESANNTSITTLTSLCDQFSHKVTTDDLMIYLRNSEGVDLSLQSGDQLSIDGYVGGIALSNSYQTFDITDGTETYEQFLERIRKAFDITSDDGEVTISDEGYLTLKGDGGEINEITSVNIEATDRTYLNEIFDSTPNNWIETQEAGDVEAAASATVFDSMGQRHVLTLNFKKDAKTTNKWFFEMAVNEPAAISGGSTGYILFNTDGSLNTYVHDGAATTVSFSPKTGAIDPVNMKINPGTVGLFDGISQLGTFTSLVASDQDGYGMGELDSISIDNEGQITGTFTNGANQFMGQLAIATFNNPRGLKRGSDNTFHESANSGTPIVGYAGTSIPSKINPGALEQSNVELAQEFTNMIVAQRGFQANARVISTSDQILNEIVNLKT
ncbi:flagellar hook-basal body complex protein, partial [bacterium]|nr:flagellar hook-basal body complex protein [bacterium]